MKAAKLNLQSVFLLWLMGMMRTNIKEHSFSLLGAHGIDICWVLRYSGQTDGYFGRFRIFSKPNSLGWGESQKVNQ